MKRKLSQFVMKSIFIFAFIYSSTNSYAQSSFNSLVQTHPVSNVSNTTAYCGGLVNITSHYVIRKGVCWSTSPNPTINNNKTSEGAGALKFSSQIAGLAPSTTYYLRAYATTTTSNTEYGNEIVFRTLPTPSTPLVTLSTISVTSKIINSGLHHVTVKSNVNKDNGYPVIVRGICWGKSPNPRIEDNYHNITVDGSGLGAYETQITLDEGNIYYIRSYAYSVSGISYGNELEYKIPMTETRKSQFTIQEYSAIDVDMSRGATQIDGWTMQTVIPGHVSTGKFDSHLQISNSYYPGANSVVKFYLSNDINLDSKDILIEKKTLYIPQYTNMYNFTVSVPYYFISFPGKQYVIAEIQTELEDNYANSEYKDKYIIRSGSNIQAIGSIFIKGDGLKSGLFQQQMEETDLVNLKTESLISKEVFCQLMDEKSTIRVSVPSQYIGGCITVCDVYGLNFKQIKITDTEMDIPNDWKYLSKFIVVKIMNNNESSTFKFAN